MSAPSHLPSTCWILVVACVHEQLAAGAPCATVTVVDVTVCALPGGGGGGGGGHPRGLSSSFAAVCAASRVALDEVEADVRAVDISHPIPAGVSKRMKRRIKLGLKHHLGTHAGPAAAPGGLVLSTRA